jgi:hypothetical protein
VGHFNGDHPELDGLWPLSSSDFAGDGVFAARVMAWHFPRIALGLVPADRAGLGTGLYFGGIGEATARLSTLLLQIDPVPTSWGFAMGAIAFVLAIVCLS